jgi:hypothetical protein
VTDPAISATAGGVLVHVHVQPRASRTEVAGRHGDAIKVRLKAPPVDGAANEELLRFLAECLGVSSREVQLVRGATSRSKTVAVMGMAEAVVAAALVPPVAKD